jgi:hypothetical protein
MVHTWTWRLTVLAFANKFQYLWIKEIERESSGFLQKSVLLPLPLWALILVVHCVMVPLLSIQAAAFNNNKFSFFSIDSGS